MNSRLPLLVSIIIAAGALYGGYRLSKRGPASESAPAGGAAISYGRVESGSLRDYCQSRGKAPEDYLTLAVRGCPPQAPADVAAEVEAVVDFRNCSGTALIPKR